MDFNMPIMNGVEAAKKIREMQFKREASDRMTLVLVSGDKMSEAGAHYFNHSLTKPIKITDLQRVIKD